MAEMWTQNNVEYLLYYLYDENGAPIGLQYRTSNYASGVFDFFFFDKNLQGDIIGIYASDGYKICTYTYDAWGICTAAIGMYKVPEEDIQMFIRVEKVLAARHRFQKYQYSPNKEDGN